MKSTEEIVSKAIRHFCAYRERSQQEVRDKLYDMGLHQREVENTIANLISQGFLNEERFAKAFAGGKFRINGWGKIKIRNALIQKKVSPQCIKLGLNSIDDRDYSASLKKILNQKLKSAEKNIYIKKNKAARFALSRGFEPELVWGILGEPGEE
jgi:regulatory protein